MARPLDFGRTSKATQPGLLDDRPVSHAHGHQSLVDGTVFGIVSYGTNPDSLLWIQFRKSESEAELSMEYGFLALTGDAVTVEQEDGPTVFTHAGSKTPGDHGRWPWLLLSND